MCSVIIFVIEQKPCMVPQLKNEGKCFYVKIYRKSNVINDRTQIDNHKNVNREQSGFNKYLNLFHLFGVPLTWVMDLQRNVGSLTQELDHNVKTYWNYYIPTLPPDVYAFTVT